MTVATIRTARPEDARRLLEIYAYYVEKTAITFEYKVPALAEFEDRICHTLERYPYLVIEVDAPSIERNASHLDGAAETPPPFGRRISHSKNEDEMQIMGYAYAGPLKERAAYDWACELSIYLDRNAQKRGLGRMLYEALEERLREMGIRNLYACIACPSSERKMSQRGKTQREPWDLHALQSEHGSNGGEALEEDPYLNWNSVDFHTHLGYRLVGTFYKCGYKFGRWYDMVWMEKLIGAHEDVQMPVRFGS